MATTVPKGYRLRHSPSELLEHHCEKLEGDAKIDDLFRLEEIIQSGSFGEVTRCRPTDQGAALLRKGGVKEIPASVAVKKMLSTLGELALEETVTDILMLKTLTEKGLTCIPHYYGCFVGKQEGKDVVYFVMEWIEGQDLIDFANSDEIRYGPDTRLAFAKFIIEHGAKALYSLHSAGVVHGDVRLENIRLKIVDGEVTKLYLIDLGGGCFKGGSEKDIPLPICPTAFDLEGRVSRADPFLYMKGLAAKKNDKVKVTFADWVHGDWWSFGLAVYMFLTLDQNPYIAFYDDEMFDRWKTHEERARPYDDVTKEQLFLKRFAKTPEMKTLGPDVRKYLFENLKISFFDTAGLGPRFAEVEHMLMMGIPLPAKFDRWMGRLQDLLKSLVWGAAGSRK